MNRHIVTFAGVILLSGSWVSAAERSQQSYLRNIGSDSSRVQRMFWRASQPEEALRREPAKKIETPAEASKSAKADLPSPLVEKTR